MLSWVGLWHGVARILGYLTHAHSVLITAVQRGVVRIAHRFVVADLNVAAAAAVSSNKILFPFSVVGCSC